ncbi:hypothetical protein XM38_022500 [Halomicronema hongdechloris C2206]|uniref:Uncharacterized protein n=1 Tax=Halomicronema hongdechloris C2206 TaxID=1641165 RepID=A0A1Z3HLX7_9CYAN|nr:hypothetical protein [Halomicronema hongdechloris]ASC71298.1 hypothetical protein XM38_022500 [Halomicronema hongdechloris C2206]
MKVGDLVRLKQPFRPTITSPETFYFGKVAGIIATESDPEVLVYLCNSDGSEIYVDELGYQAIYSFRLDEVEC